MSTIIFGDIAEGQKWFSLADHQKRELARLYAQNNAWMQKWTFVNADVKIHCMMRGGQPVAFIYAGGGEVFITYPDILNLDNSLVYLGQAADKYLPTEKTNFHSGKGYWYSKSWMGKKRCLSWYVTTIYIGGKSCLLPIGTARIACAAWTTGGDILVISSNTGRVELHVFRIASSDSTTFEVEYTHFSVIQNDGREVAKGFLTDAATLYTLSDGGSPYYPQILHKYIINADYTFSSAWKVDGIGGLIDTYSLVSGTTISQTYINLDSNGNDYGATSHHLYPFDEGTTTVANTLGRDFIRSVFIQEDEVTVTAYSIDSSSQSTHTLQTANYYIDPVEFATADNSYTSTRNSVFKVYKLEGLTLTPSSIPSLHYTFSQVSTASSSVTNGVQDYNISAFTESAPSKRFIYANEALGLAVYSVQTHSYSDVQPTPVSASEVYIYFNAVDTLIDSSAYAPPLQDVAQYGTITSATTTTTSSSTEDIDNDGYITRVTTTTTNSSGGTQGIYYRGPADGTDGYSYDGKLLILTYSIPTSATVLETKTLIINTEAKDGAGAPILDYRLIDTVTTQFSVTQLTY